MIRRALGIGRDLALGVAYIVVLLLDTDAATRSQWLTPDPLVVAGLDPWLAEQWQLEQAMLRHPAGSR